MINRRAQQSFAEYMTVGEAALFLGVSPWTLRNWDRSGRLRPTRHPKNGYRIYRQSDLEAVLEPDGSIATIDAALAPRFDWSRSDNKEHLVQFYESDAYLVSAISALVKKALSSGEASVIIATAAHREAVEQELQSRGIDLEAARSAHTYWALDARRTLEQFMLDGSPDPQRFFQIIGSVIEQAAGDGRRVRAFGEMVALLWTQGSRAAAIELEQLWNELAKTHSFSLCCAYPINGFAGEAAGERFEDVCTCHTRVIPAESYSGLSRSDQRLRQISQLQRKAQSLEAQIAQRKEVEQALRDSEQRYRALMEMLPAGVYSCDAPSGEIRYYNRRAAEMWGREPAVGESDERFCGALRLYRIDGSPLPHADTPMAHVLRGGPAVRNQEVMIERPDGSRVVAVVNIDRILDSAGNCVGAVNVFQDITERKQTELELQEAKRVAEQASRAKDQFLAVLSHELRTPLTPVLMSVASMETEPGLPPRVREDLNMIRRNIALETQLIDDLLDLSRIANGKMVLHKRDLPVHPLIRNVLEMAAAEAHAKSLRVQLELSASQDRLHGDSARLHQVLWNLIKNAIKFTPEGGAITISTRNPAPGRISIAIRDTGIGIDTGALATIFSAFDQGQLGASRAFGGLGLGLAISKAVVELHEGTISAQSAGRGLGACFTLEFDVAPAARTHIPLSRPQLDSQAPAVRCTRILLVDDHLDTLKILRRLLEGAGHAVATASSVIEAIRAADSEQFDLLISDIGLPDGTGLDVVRQVRLRQPQLPAIALTGFGMEQDVRNTEQAGFCKHLTKPVAMEALEAAIKALTSSAT